MVDGDTKVDQAATARGNIVKLPCVAGARGTDRSPENSIRLFLHSVAEAQDGPLRAALLQFKVVNPTSDKIRTTFFNDGLGTSAERTKTKAWWTEKWKKLESWGVIGVWANLHHNEVQTFTQQLEQACTVTAARVKQTMAGRVRR